MLKIRFQRVGRKHEPVFRLVVVDSHSGPKSGKVKEILGSYDSRKGENAELKAERIKHWISLGAQTSDTVNNILISNKIIEGKKINALPKKSPIIKEQPEGQAKAETKPAETQEEVVKTEEKQEEAKEEISIVEEKTEEAPVAEEKKEEVTETPKESESEQKEEAPTEPEEEPKG